MYVCEPVMHLKDQVMKIKNVIRKRMAKNVLISGKSCCKGKLNGQKKFHVDKLSTTCYSFVFIRKRKQKS